MDIIGRGTTNLLKEEYINKNLDHFQIIEEIKIMMKIIFLITN